VHDIFRAICEDPPVLPSVVAAQSAPASRRRLSGDLDSIVLKALRKEPNWRYASAEELSDDIGRHMEGLPVSARKDTFRYRLGKAVRRLIYPSKHAFQINSGLMAGWGMFGALALIEKQIIALGWDSSPDMPYAFPAMIMNIIWSIRESRRLSASPDTSPLGRQASIVFAVTICTLLLLLLLSAATNVIPEAAVAVFWNAGLAMAFLILGLQASRLLTGAGLTLLGSVVIGSFFPFWLYGCLAAGMLVGCVIPGLVHAFRKPDIPDIGAQTLSLTSKGPLES
jgi:hypothetical protein